MGNRSLQILPNFEIVVEYPDDLDIQVISAASVVAIVGALAIVDDGVYVKGAKVTAPDRDHVQIGFYRQPGRNLREYTFTLSELAASTRQGGVLLNYGPLDGELANRAIAEVRSQIQPYRRW
jgi:hypothetical protein